MLDIKFLRSLGIKENLLPKANAERNESAEQARTDDLPLAGELMFPSELMELSKEELKSFIINNHSQDSPYTYMTPKGHIIAVYADSAPQGQHDLEFTVDEFLVMLSLTKILGGRPTVYKANQGSWVSWT
jgi:hypothetical protein